MRAEAIFANAIEGLQVSNDAAIAERFEGSTRVFVLSHAVREVRQL